MTKLPEPSCPHGYTDDDLKAILGDDPVRWDEFHLWMYGQTMSLCDGRLYNHERKQYENSPCVDNPHGVVVYRGDLRRFLEGRPVID